MVDSSSARFLRYIPSNVYFRDLQIVIDETAVWLTPCQVPFDFTATAILCRVMLGSSASHILCCIYKSDGDIPDEQPLVVKSLEYTVPSTSLTPFETNLIEVPITPTPLSKGLYWVGFQIQEANRKSDRASLMVAFREFVNTYGDFPAVCPETVGTQTGFAAILKGL